MLAVLGDLIEDLVVVLDGPIQLASDTKSNITRRRGGSAANVAATAGLLGKRARFLGQVGDDAIGAALITELSNSGVDTKFVRRSGGTGTIIVLVDEHGERSMLTDRKSCSGLDQPDQAWLDGIDTLHVPLYGFAEGELAVAAQTMVGWAHQRGIGVSIDASSVSLIEAMGVDAVRRLLDQLAPDVLLANEAEAIVLGFSNSTGVGADALAPLMVIKHGGAPAQLLRAGAPPVEVPAERIERVRDSTAAGDAFAAGFLTASWRTDPVEACRRGHTAAAMVLRGR